MRRSRKHHSELAAGIAFILPNFLGFLVFCAGPLVFSLGASMTDWTLTRPGELHWVWFRNYAELFSEADFWRYFVNTIYLMLAIPFAIAGSLFLATLLTRKLRGVPVYRTMFYLPHFTSGVALFILWKALYNPEFGPINAAIEGLLSLLGLAQVSAPNWLISTKNLLCLTVERVGLDPGMFGLGAREAIMGMGIWIGIGGNNMLLYIAALSNVPLELYEAAEIDGAGRWAQFRHVTWPQLAPTTFFITIMSIIGGMQGGFEQARVMTGGGPSGTTTTISYYIYTKCFQEFQIGYASSIAWVLFAMVFGMTLVTWRHGSRKINV